MAFAIANRPTMIAVRPKLRGASGEGGKHSMGFAGGHDEILDLVYETSVDASVWPRLLERLNAAYVGFFAADRLPARTVIGVDHLTRGSQVEMDFVLCSAY